MTEAACWAHVGRKFFDVHAESKSPLALEALQRIAALYEIEPRLRGQSAAARQAGRCAQSAPLFAALRRFLEASLARISGKSELAIAIRSTLSRWQALTLVLRDGRACLDNNAAERSMRPMCLGRKNWLFSGSDAGGERAAAAYSLIETAKLSGLDPEHYLRHVLERIADHPVKRVVDEPSSRLMPRADRTRDTSPCPAPLQRVKTESCNAASPSPSGRGRETDGGGWEAGALS